MPPSRGRLKLALYALSSNPGFERLREESVLDRVRLVDARAREKGLASLKPSSDNLIPIGMEINGAGEVTKNGYGVLSLPWQAEQHPEWADAVRQEVLEIRAAIRRDHGVRLRYLIWAGMGGSAEDKAFIRPPVYSARACGFTFSIPPTRPSCAPSSTISRRPRNSL